jgi:hypothetical protein
VTATEPLLARGVFAEPFPSNGYLYWLHNSGFQQTYHSTVDYIGLMAELSANVELEMM